MLKMDALLRTIRLRARVQAGFGGLVENARGMSDAELQDAFKALIGT